MIHFFRTKRHGSFLWLFFLLALVDTPSTSLTWVNCTTIMITNVYGSTQGFGNAVAHGPFSWIYPNGQSVPLTNAYRWGYEVHGVSGFLNLFTGARRFAAARAMYGCVVDQHTAYSLCLATLTCRYHVYW